MRIGDLARETGSGRATLDRYAQFGLVPFVEDVRNGYREFSEEAVLRVQLIQDLKRRPFRYGLDEIRRIFDKVPLAELDRRRVASKKDLLLYLIEVGLP